MSAGEGNIHVADVRDGREKTSLSNGNRRLAFLGCRRQLICGNERDVRIAGIRLWFELQLVHV